MLTSYKNQLVEIGITSYGPSDCDTVSADFFTAIQPQSSWIKSEIEAVHPMPSPHTAPVVECVVPLLTGKTVNQAKTTLNKARCSIGKVYEPKHVANHHKLKVVSQSPRKGS